MKGRKIMSNRIKKKQETKSTYQENTALILGIFTLVILCIMPLVFHNFYFDILETKYQFYCASAIVMIVVMAGYGLASGRAGLFLKNIKIKELVKSLSIADWAMLFFWLSNVISWLLCFEWRWEAFWGTSGRYNGVFLMTIYMIVYFLMTRFFHFRQWYLDAFLAVGILVCVFGITDYFQMDILGFKVDMVEAQKGIYTSTFGNINTYTIYVGAVMVVSMILFALEKNQKRMMWYLGNMVLSSFALIMGTSDNAYLTLAALFGLSPLYLFRTKTGIRRYLISVASFFSVIQCIDWINGACAESVLGIDSAFNLIASLSILPLIVIALWAAVGVVSFVTLKKNTENSADGVGKGPIYAWITVIAIVVITVIFVFYDANIAGNAERYGAVSSYVVFDDNWGTERGYVWRRCIELFTTKLNFLQKVFGYGPDTFALLMQYYYDGKKMGDRMIIYDSAHNEYLHYLITIGLTGMISYIVFMGASVVRMAKNLKERPEVAAVMFVVIAYMIQAVVNINLPIAMPIILNLLAMGVSVKKDQ